MIAAKVAIVLLTAVVIQAAALAHLTILGARGDILLLVAVAAGFEGGPERGAIVGFAAGLGLDLMLSQPAGLSALTFTVVGYGVGLFRSSVLRNSRVVPVLTAVVASAAGVVLHWILAALLGRTAGLGASLPAIIVVVAVLNGALSPLVLWVTRWSFRDAGAERMTLR